MKARIISGALVAFVTIFSLYFGGYILDALLVFISVYAAYEFIKIRKQQFNVFLFILMLTAILLNIFYHDVIDIVSLLLMAILLGYCVFDESENFTDITAVFLMSLLVGWGFYFIRHLQNINKWLVGYVFVITYITDVFAYFIGMKFGKHKLIPRISPNKTIEGSVAGWLFGFILSFGWATYFKYFGFDMYLFLISSLLLPIVSQTGDLVFSMIKRHYGVKDFSNLIKGHGGILDRLDSNIFCMIIFGALLILFL